MWILDQDEEGLYFLDHDAKGGLKDLTLGDLELLASMFDDEVVEVLDEVCLIRKGYPIGVTR